MVRAEVDCEDVVTEACKVIQLSEMALQRAAGKTGFMKGSQETKHKGIQTGWPKSTNTHMYRNIHSDMSGLIEGLHKPSIRKSVKHFFPAQNRAARLINFSFKISPS